MSRTRCPQRDLAVGWALHSLEPEEEAGVALHLPHCADCRTQVEQTEQTAVLLSSAVPQLDPPARLRASILEAARAAGPAEAPRRPVSPASHRRAEPEERPVGNSRRVLVAAAAVLVLGLGAVGGFAASSITSDPATPSVVADAAPDAVLADLADPSVRQVLLTDQGSTAPVAVLLTAPDHDVVLPVNLPDLGADEAVWVWGVDADDVPVPLGDVVASTDGGDAALGARQVTTVSADRQVYDRYALSVEPAGAVPTVPTTVIASGAVRA